MNEHRGPTSKRSVMIAAGAALCLLIGSGAGYRILAQYLAGPGSSAPLPPGALQRLPMKIGDWVGRDVKLGEAIVAATDTDAHVHRRDRKSNGSRGVALYVAYGVRARDLMPHRPEVCYPGNGWTLRDVRSVNLPLADETILPCRIFRFSRADENITVLNYYVVDGQRSPDVSLLRSKAWSGQGGIGYMAQVQITCGGSQGLSGGSSDKAISAFAADSARDICDLFPRRVRDTGAIDAQSNAMQESRGGGND